MNPRPNTAADQVLRAVSHFFECHTIPQGKYLVAVSGGVDSVVLLKALHTLKAKLKIELGVFHLNHLFRGDLADHDAKCVAQMANALNLDYFGYRRPVAAMAENLGLGFEAMGRKVRYDLAQTLMTCHGYRGIFTAHHADDQAETILMHLFRGSSLKGLTGIAPIHARKLRPLLHVEKTILLQAAAEWTLKYGEDHTNADNTYLRNSVRNTLLPLVATQFGHHVSLQLAQMAEVLRDDEDYFQRETTSFLNAHLHREEDAYLLDFAPLIHLPVSLQRRVLVAYLHEILGFATDLTRQPIENLLAWMRQSQAGATHSYRGVHFEKRRHQIRAMALKYYSKKFDAKGFILQLGVQRPENWGMEWNVTQIAKCNIANSDYTRSDILLLPGQWVADQLFVRPRQEGDVIAMPGMKGKRKAIKKLLAEWDLATDQKATLPLLQFNEHILWIPHRVKSDVLTNAFSLSECAKESDQFVRIEVNTHYK